MKTQLLFAALFAASFTTFAQVGIGTTNPQGVLDVVSTNSGVVTPRVATIGAITTPIDGMIAYIIDQKCLKGYQDGAWEDLTTCSPITTAITFDSLTYNGATILGAIGYNGEVVPSASTLTVNVTTTAATPYSFIATDAPTGLEYTATGYFASAGTYSVILRHNSPTIAATTYGLITMTLTGASNTLLMYPRVDLKSIPASETTVVDITHGSQTWMDRNLGARQAATDINDVLAHGNHYQWGRPSDGHELGVWQGNDTNTVYIGNVTALGALATTDAPAHSNFIIMNVAPFDWRDDNNNNRWVTANQGPCPTGYHVPTVAEWVTADTWNTATEVFASPLKLTLSGARLYGDGTKANQTLNGHYWSSSSTTSAGGDFVSHRFQFNSTTAEINTGFASFRGLGFSVRCIKD